MPRTHQHAESTKSGRASVEPLLNMRGNEWHTLASHGQDCMYPFEANVKNCVPIYYKSCESVRDQMFKRTCRWIIGRVVTRWHTRRPQIEAAHLYQSAQSPQLNLSLWVSTPLCKEINEDLAASLECGCHECQRIEFSKQKK